MSEEPPSPGMAISVVVQDQAWRELLPRPEFVAERASRAALDSQAAENAPLVPPQGAELCIVLASDDLVRKLNRTYCHLDRATNVLSFADLDSPAEAAPGAPRIMGDVVLARETIQKEAREQHKSMADHLSHLVVHGVLHLLGYDHQDDRDAERMEHLERTILNRLGVADPYRSGAAAECREVLD